MADKMTNKFCCYPRHKLHSFPHPSIALSDSWRLKSNVDLLKEGKARVDGEKPFGIKRFSHKCRKAKTKAITEPTTSTS